MYLELNELEATKGNLVLRIIHWPASAVSTSIISVKNNTYDNGRELYLAEVTSSGSDKIKEGEYIAVDIFYGAHIPSANKNDKIKIVPDTAAVLHNKEKLEVMGDIVKMEPGIDRILVKLKKKEAITSGGIIIPDTVIANDPTAEDVRIGEVIDSDVKEFKAGDNIVIEAFIGKDVYLDIEKNLYITCYASDVLAKLK